MAAAATNRPVMCHALVRCAGAVAAANAIASRKPMPAATSGVSTRGHDRVHNIATPHATSAASTAASRLLTDCHGRRTSGLVASNGATTARRNTPAAATPLDTSDNAPTAMTDNNANAVVKNSKKLATEIESRRKARLLHTATSHAIHERGKRVGRATRVARLYGGRKLVSKRETHAADARRLQDR